MDLIKETAKRIKPVDRKLVKQAEDHLANLTKPVKSLGRLEDFAARIAAITNRVEKPVLTNKVIITMAADHGIAAQGVSAYPKEVTPQMVYNFVNEGAAINVLARHAGAKILVVDMGVAKDLSELAAQGKIIDRKIAYGTKDFSTGPAMTREEAIAAVTAGIELAENEIKNGAHIIGTGDMGIGNTTPASAIIAAFSGIAIPELTGRGTGIDDKTLEKKVRMIQTGLLLNHPNSKDPVDVLAKVGGFEIGGIAGVILACAANNIPVAVDGFISTAGAIIAAELSPFAVEYMFASHKSQEKGHRYMLERLGLVPVLDMEMRLGEGTGAALAMTMLDASVKIYNEMATFRSAGVSEKTN